MLNPHSQDVGPSSASASNGGAALDAEDNDPRITTGDRVRLKSGSAVMTAERVYEQVRAPFAKCSWFDARDKLQRACFDLGALVLFKPEGEPPSTP